MTEKRPRVLYVEDEKMLWRIVERHLRTDYDVCCAENDRAACELLASETFDAVLMDVDLHDSLLDGIRIVRLMRGRLPLEDLPAYARSVPVSTTPVIFVTAYASRAADDLDENDYHSVMTKPVDFCEIKTRLAAAIGGVPAMQAARR